MSSPYMFRRCSVGYQLPQVMSETATKIQQSVSMLHTVNDLGIQWVFVECQDEKLELSNTWIRADIKSFRSLELSSS